jgi:HAD superfamily hydrolase (TIGR01509 family)
LNRRLAARAELWIISNTNKLHFDFLRDRFPFFGFFKGFVLSHEVGAMKPDPRIFREALARAGSKASESLFVDDQLVNVEAARELGIEAFQFLSPDQCRSELRKRQLL